MTDQLTHELTVTSSATDLDARLAPVLTAATADAARVDRDGAYPEASVDALRASGLFGLTLPTSVGGLGAGPAEFSRVVYEIAGACGSTSMIYLMHVAAAMTVASSPPIGQPDLLVGMADGSVLGTLAFSERGSRSHFWAPVSQLVPDGEGVRLRASKSWVTSAGHFQVVVASAQSAGGEGVDLFALRSGIEGSVSVLVEVGADGVPTDVRVVRRSGERSRDLDRAVTSAALDWRFEPALRNGRAVAGAVVLPVDFKRE